MRFLFLFFSGLLLAIPGQAQNPVRRIRVDVADSSRLEIRYDLFSTKVGDSIYFSVKSRLRGTVAVSPEFVRGDVGRDVTAGTDRLIIWEALANGFSLNEEIRVTVLVRSGPPPKKARPTQPTLAGKPTTSPPAPDAVPAPLPTDRPAVTVIPKPTNQPQKTESPSVLPNSQPTQPLEKPQPRADTTRPTTVEEIPAIVDSARVHKRRYAGPAWALLSVVAPGVGNIFVQRPKPRVGFRPLVAAGCYGLIAYGLLERQKARDEYVVYQEQKNFATGEPIYQIANDYHHRYWLATRGAIAVAAADVLLTFFKGLNNSRIQKESRRRQTVTLRPGLQAGQPTAVVRLSF